MDRREIEEKILDVANCYPEATTSDLQGMCAGLAAEIARSNPRAPTNLELDAMAEPLARRQQIGCDEALDELQGARIAGRIAVFDNYIPDCPGYCGRVAIVLWGGGPECSDTFMLDCKVPGEVTVQLVEYLR